MHDVTRKRLWRKLEALPEERLYQVLDFIEFLESKYARGRSPEPSGLQRVAERLEDRMRTRRSVAPQVMRGAVGLLGTAGRVLDGVANAGRGILRELDTTTRRTDASPRQGERHPPAVSGTRAGAPRAPQVKKAGEQAPVQDQPRPIATDGGVAPNGADSRPADEAPGPVPRD